MEQAFCALLLLAMIALMIWQTGKVWEKTQALIAWHRATSALQNYTIDMPDNHANYLIPTTMTEFEEAVTEKQALLRDPIGAKLLENQFRAYVDAIEKKAVKGAKTHLIDSLDTTKDRKLEQRALNIIFFGKSEDEEKSDP